MSVVRLSFILLMLYLCMFMYVYDWRHGSVARTSVFGWRTFPDLRLIYG